MVKGSAGNPDTAVHTHGDKSEPAHHEMREDLHHALGTLAGFFGVLLTWHDATT